MLADPASQNDRESGGHQPPNEGYGSLLPAPARFCALQPRPVLDGWVVMNGTKCRTHVLGLVRDRGEECCRGRNHDGDNQGWRAETHGTHADAE